MMLIVLATVLSIPTFTANGFQDEAENTIKTAIVQDDMTVVDMREWYSVYKGCCLWGREFDFMGVRDNGPIFERLRAVRDKIQPSKGAVNSSKAIQVFLDKYKDIDWDTNKKNELIDDLFYISEGFRLALNEKENE